METVKDLSNGWEGVAPEFIENSRQSTTGAEAVARWAKNLADGAVVLDLGCGPGSPRSDSINAGRFSVYAIDASASLANAYQERFPSACVACEAAEESDFFKRKFDGVLAWGLLFLLSSETQRRVIFRVAASLDAGGRFLFTAPVQECTWADLSTGLESRSLGADAYRSIAADAGLTVVAEHDDEGDNHYYDTTRP